MKLQLFPFLEVSRNDSCPDLPEIQNGWKTTSHIALVRGAQITYQCDPGYDLVGRETLTCELELSWSSQPPFCEKSQSPLSRGVFELPVLMHGRCTCCTFSDVCRHRKDFQSVEFEVLTKGYRSETRLRYRLKTFSPSLLV